MSSHTSLLARRKNKFSVSNLHQSLNDSQTKAKENPFGTEEVTLQKELGEQTIILANRMARLEIRMSRIKVMIRDLQIVLRVALSGAEWGSGRGADSRPSSVVNDQSIMSGGPDGDALNANSFTTIQSVFGSVRDNVQLETSTDFKSLNRSTTDPMSFLAQGAHMTDSSTDVMQLGIASVRHSSTDVHSFNQSQPTRDGYISDADHQDELEANRMLGADNHTMDSYGAFNHYVVDTHDDDENDDDELRF